MFGSIILFLYFTSIQFSPIIDFHFFFVFSEAILILKFFSLSISAAFFMFVSIIFFHRLIEKSVEHSKYFDLFFTLIILIFSSVSFF